MGLGEKFRRVVRQQARKAGRQYAASKRAYQEGRETTEAGEPPVDPSVFDLPATDGEARIVCRRYAERRTVPVDEAGQPPCFEAGNPACEGCVEDIRDGRVETW